MNRIDDEYTVGELARQVNHDIKNGLIPLRNVMRHLSQVEQADPQALAGVFAERRPTVDSSLAYLETLATSYQRLSPPLDRRECDLNALIAEVVRAQGREQIDFTTDLANLPPIVGDPIYRSGGEVGAPQTLSVNDPPLCLHAVSLEFTHPATGERVEFTASRPTWAECS